MALLGSFTDSRIIKWTKNRKSFEFKHGLPEKPDQIIVYPMNIKGKIKKKGYIKHIFMGYGMIKK